MAEQPKPPEPQPTEEKPFGGEIPVGGGGAPRWMKWLTTVLFAWAVAYLVVAFIRGWADEAAWLVLVFGGALVAWYLFFTITKRPADP